VLDLVKNADGSTQNDADGKPFTTLVFGNGPNRQDQRPTLTSDEVMADDYLQDRVKLGSETHGGGDVMLFAGGAGSSQFKGTLDNTRVFGKLGRPSACDKGPAPRRAPFPSSERR
jgi:alkaline phosphatase